MASLSACKSLPQIQGLKGDSTLAIAPTGELPPPERNSWPALQDDVLNQRAQGYGLASMPELQKYLNDLLIRIKAKASVADWPGEVHILATTALEAYSTDAGNIYVSPSWVSGAQSEDELVALLGHEFGHIYLHYHRLGETIQGSDQVATLAAFGVALAKHTAQNTGWTPVDTLMASYLMTRELSAAAWSRGQESDADAFGLNISLKLGYSYEYGMKVFLERLASWEEQNADRQTTLRQKMLEAVKEEARKAARASQQQTGNGNQATFTIPTEDLNAGIAGLFHELQQSTGDLWNNVTSRHPDILKRLDTVAQAADALPPNIASRTPTEKPLQQVLRNKRTAALIKNYGYAAEALLDVSAPNALVLAQKATNGITGRHALPIVALNNALEARGKAREAAAALSANLSSPNDAAWFVYVKRSDQLLQSGNVVGANTVFQQGFAQYQNASAVWPQSIKLTGRIQGWEQAKKLADICAKRFTSVAAQCRDAAASPAEIAQRERLNKERSEAIVKKWFKQS
ncbi:MAG: M48 family metalloprotease [Rhodocyclaceae bacterium]|nr:M48 family metalloprotease [Rhodocyclaceae bacterium]